MAEGCPGGLVLAGVSDMTVRMIALAGVSLLAFTLAATAQESGGATSGGATSSAPSAPPMQPAPPPPPPPPPPAPAPMGEWMTQGWYVGAGAGFDRLGNVEEVSAFPGNATVGTDNAALITGEIGYRFPDRLRLEGEFGWDQHDLKDTSFSGEDFSGHVSTFSFLANVAYDFPLSSKWDFTLGAGAGVGNFDVKVSGNFGDSTSGKQPGLHVSGLCRLRLLGSPDMQRESRLALSRPDRERELHLRQRRFPLPDQGHSRSGFDAERRGTTPSRAH